MKALAVLTLCGLGVLIVITEIRRHRALPYDFLTLFNISYFVYFVLAPIHLMLGGGRFSYFPRAVDVILSTHDTKFFIGYVYLIVATWWAVCVAYSWGQRKGSVFNRKAVQVGQSDLVGLSVVFAVVGAISIIVYSAQYGGLDFAIRNAAEIRGRVISSDSPLLFLRNISMFAVSAALLSFCVIANLSGKRDRIIGVFYVFAVLSLAFIAIALQGSRRSYVIFLGCAGLFVANYRRRFYFTALAVISGVGLAYVAVGDLLNLGLSQGLDFVVQGLTAYWREGLSVAYAQVWRDFTLPAYESWIVVDRFNSFPRLFVDIPLGVLQLIPQRLMALPLPERLSGVSTQLIAGQSAADVAEVPPGFIGFFWYSGFLPFLLAGTLLFGFVGGYLERILRPVQRGPAVDYLVYTLAAFLWAYFLREGVPYMLLVERFHWWALILGLMLLKAIIARRGKAEIGWS